MQTVLLIIHLLIIVAMVTVILLQQSSGGGLGFSANKDFMSARGSKNALTRLTAILATIFFILSMLITVISNTTVSNNQVLKDITAGQQSKPVTSVNPITIEQKTNVKK